MRKIITERKKKENFFLIPLFSNQKPRKHKAGKSWREFRVWILVAWAAMNFSRLPTDDDDEGPEQCSGWLDETFLPAYVTHDAARTSGGNDTFGFDAAAALEGFRARRGLTSFCARGRRGGRGEPASKYSGQAEIDDESANEN